MCHHTVKVIYCIFQYITELISNFPSEIEQNEVWLKTHVENKTWILLNS